jgi:hypothetical protein
MPFKLTLHGFKMEVCVELKNKGCQVDELVMIWNLVSRIVRLLVPFIIALSLFIKLFEASFVNLLNHLVAKFLRHTGFEPLQVMYHKAF